MKILKFLLGLACVILLLGFFAPKETSLQREILIKAPINSVFQVLNSMRRFNEWSPWHALDPENTRYEFRGPDSGPGAYMRWSSDNPNIGNGSQEITHSEAPLNVSVALDFGAMGQAQADYTLSASAQGTRVVWGFTGYNEGLVQRLMGLLTPLFLGPVYEQGLENLKKLMETEA